MATVGHLALGAAAGRWQCRNRRDLLRHLVVYAALAVLPDLDLVAVLLGTGGALPHRGPTHSLLFAAAVAMLFALLAPRLFPGASRASAGAVAFLAVASHGIVDPLMATSTGTALLWPFSASVFTWGGFQPIPDALAAAGGRWPFVSVRGLVGEALLFAPLAVYAIWPRRLAPRWTVRGVGRAALAPRPVQDAVE